MRNYTENVWDEIEPVTERALNIGLERVIDQLSDDKAPRPERVRQARTRRRRAELDETASIAPMRFAIERVIAGNELTHIHYLQRGLTSAKAVGRVVVRDNTGTVIGYGTGFLVANGVLATNAHVLMSPEEVASSGVQFRYELDEGGGEITPVEFEMSSTPEPIISREMDLTLAAVEPVSKDGRELNEFGWLRMDPTPGKGVIGEYLTIIQHPGGERKQICVRENKLLKYDANGPYVWYQTDTVGGSSGSPVFNNNWDVVALHHSAVPRTDTVDGRRVFLTRTGQVWDPSMGDDAIDWFANEGIRISRIIEYLRAVWPFHPIAQQIFRAEPSPLRNGAESIAQGPSVSPDGVLRLNLPIEVRIGPSGVWGTAARQPIPAIDRSALASVTPLVATPLEGVRVDQSNYDERNGYEERFLARNLPVPLPTIPRATVQKFGQTAQNGLRLKYYNYSVVFNKERRLAYYSACNVRADLLKGSRPTDDDWFHDPRLGDSQPPLEIDDTWYGQQRMFEADRRFNPFDRGHLCARNHLQWGHTDDEAKRNGDDSYHFTNCSPQHWQFNQNSSINGLWFATEDEVLKLTAAKRLCVINGPVFDAPHSHQEPDGQWRLDPHGERAPDPVFGGVAVPKQFFKIIAWKDQNLRCVGFVVTQEGLLETVERMVWPDVDPEEAVKPKGLTDGEAALYRLPISTIASLTGLRFGELEDVPSPLTEELALEGQSIESRTDLGREIARA